MIVEIPQKFLSKPSYPSIKFEKVFVNTRNIVYIKADAYDYNGKDIQYSISLCLTNGYAITMAQLINEKLMLDFVEWVDEICAKEQ